MQINQHIRTIQIEIRRVPRTLCRSRNKAFCFLCNEQVELVSIPQAAEQCGTTQYEIYQLAEKREVHRIHNAKGNIMVCRKSLEIVEENFRSARTIVLKPLELCQ